MVFGSCGVDIYSKNKVFSVGIKILLIKGTLPVLLVLKLRVISYHLKRWMVDNMSYVLAVKFIFSKQAGVVLVKLNSK